MPASFPAGPAPGFIPYGPGVVHSGPVDVSKPIDLGNLHGKTILITGGASGFGASCAQHWSTHGANIIIGDRNTALGTELIASLRQSSGHGHHHFLPLDVTSWSSQATFFRDAAKLSPHGGIDTVMANAGIADADEQLLFEDGAIDYSGLDNPPPPSIRTYETNLTGVLYTSHLALSYLARNPGSEKCSTSEEPRQRDRHLLLVASIAGLAGLPGQSLYAAAKHGVVGLFRSLRITSVVTTGVRVNMINPYFVDTPLLGPGIFVLAGGTTASLSSVVAASTRLVADQSIIGRALIIGSRTSTAHAQLTGLESDMKVEDQDVWDCYAEDFEQSDLFTRRIIAVTNLVIGVKGWVGFFGDMGVAMGKMVSRALGWK